MYKLIFTAFIVLLIGCKILRKEIPVNFEMCERGK